MFGKNEDTKGEKELGAENVNPDADAKTIGPEELTKTEADDMPEDNDDVATDKEKEASQEAKNQERYAKEKEDNAVAKNDRVGINS